MNYADMFNTLHPGFFEKESICTLPPEYIFDEQVLDLHTWQEGGRKASVGEAGPEPAAPRAEGQVWAAEAEAGTCLRRPA